MKKVIKTILGLGTKKIALGVIVALVAISGISVGIYFGTKTSDDPVKNTIPKKLELSDVEEAFTNYSDDEINEFTTYFNFIDRDASIEVVNGEERSQMLEKLFLFYKNKNNLNWEAEKEIIKEFEDRNTIRNTFLEKQLDDSVKTTLESSISTLDKIQFFANLENIVFLEEDTREVISQKILDTWSNTLSSKTQIYSDLWKNFDESNFLSYAKQINDQITSTDDIKTLRIQELYQLNYDCLTQFFKDKISLFRKLNTFTLGRLLILFKWLRGVKHISLHTSTSKEQLITQYVKQYKWLRWIMSNVNNQLDEFSTFYTIYDTYLDKVLEDSIKSELEAKFDTVAKIIPFIKEQEGVITEENDSLADIITKIITRWNVLLDIQSNTIPLWENFANNEVLLNIALNSDDTLKTLDDIKKLGTERLYQLHFDAWNEYYSQKISSFTITS